VNDHAQSKRADARPVIKWLVLALLTCALICSYVDRFTYALLLEPIKKSMGASDAQLGLLNGLAFGLFFATVGLPLGILADRWSRKGTIIGGVAVWTAATALCGFAGTLPQLFLARMAVGAGESALSPAAYSIIRDRFPKKRLGLALSIYQLGTPIGAGAAFLIAGSIYSFLSRTAVPSWPLVGHLETWQQTFVIVALPGLAITALLVLLHEPKRIAVTSDMEKPEPLSWSTRWQFAKLVIAFAGNPLAYYALSLWLPAILVREHGYTPAEAGWAYGLVVITLGPLGLLAGGWISDLRMSKEGHGRHITVAFCSAALSLPLLILVGFTKSAAGLLALAGCFQLFASLPYALIPAYIQLKAPQAHRSQISALFVFVSNTICLGLGPSAIGYISGLWPSDNGALRFAVSLVGSAAIAVSLILLGPWLKRESIERGAVRTMSNFTQTLGNAT
jgi:MFS family permease